jgi:phage virion morphogenesis protein
MMPGAQIKVTIDTGSIAAGFRALQQLGREPAGMMRAIGVALVETTQRRFETGTDPAGKAWAPWSRAYAAVTTSRSILRGQSGNDGLTGSQTFKVEGRGVRVGSNKEYAAVHQFGATIVPKNGKALRFMLGDRVVFAKKVTIPARPYLGFGPADRVATLEIVHAELRLALAARRA